jgi:hypothetical protein
MAPVSGRGTSSAGGLLTVGGERGSALLSVIVGGLEPSTGVTALSRTVFVGEEFGGDTGGVGLVAGGVR